MTRDQFLTEKVLGECWHEEDYSWCGICNKSYVEHQNFSTPEGFFKLWNFCKEQEWWGKFIQKQLAITRDSTFECAFSLIFLSQLINPDTFADAIARYRGYND